MAFDRCSINDYLLTYLLTFHTSAVSFCETQYGLVDWVLQHNCRFYKKLAKGVLNECYSSDQHKATLLIVHETKNYGRATPLQLAVKADNKEFVEHPACQDLLTTVWFGRLENDYSFMYLKV